MNPHESLSTEWEGMKHELREVSDKAKELHINLQNFADIPYVKRLLQGRNNILAAVPAIEELIADRQTCIRARETAARNYALVVKGERSKEELQKTIFHFSRDLRRWMKRAQREPETLLQCELQLVEGIATPYAKMIVQFTKHNQSDEEAIEALKQQLAAALERCQTEVPAIDARINEIQDGISRHLKSAEASKDRLRAAMLDWATRDQTHATWVISHDPLWQLEVVTRYSYRWPDQPALIPNPPTIPASNGHKECRNIPRQARRNKTAETSSAPNASWRFVVVQQKPLVLPPGKTKAIRMLQAVIKEARLNGLNARIVLEKLRAVSLGTIPGKFIQDESMEGRKSLQVGSYRVIFEKDAETREIRFSMWKHDEKYLRTKD